MARSSLNDLQTFLNCQFWRNEFPFEKSAVFCLNFGRKDAVCLIFGHIRRKGWIQLPLRNLASEKHCRLVGNPGSCASTASNRYPRGSIVLVGGHFIHSTRKTPPCHSTA